jgi:hypothetical protein
MLELRSNPFTIICAGCKTFTCCDQCYASEGHFLPLPENLQELKDKYGWNKLGFLGKEGCLLPRELRSEMCLTWICKERRTKAREKTVAESIVRTTG